MAGLRLSSSSGAVRRSTLIYGSALLVVLGAAGASFALFHSNSSRPPHTPIGTSPSGRPAFEFDIRSVQPLATGNAKRASVAAHTVARRIQRTLDSLYSTGFLDPGAWQSADYGAAWKLFTPDAVATAKNDESTLTLGPKAGSQFRSVDSANGHVAIRVLMDPSGNPSTAVAIVGFAAHATRSDGSRTTIKSSGQYFLQPGARGWSIYGYQVTQDDPK